MSGRMAAPGTGCPPPHCPNPACDSHADSGVWRLEKKGFYARQRRPRRVQRYLMGAEPRD
jgi:hypothetical protein